MRHRARRSSLQAGLHAVRPSAPIAGSPCITGAWTGATTSSCLRRMGSQSWRMLPRTLNAAATPYGSHAKALASVRYRPLRRTELALHPLVELLDVHHHPLVAAVAAQVFFVLGLHPDMNLPA